MRIRLGFFITVLFLLFQGEVCRADDHLGRSLEDNANAKRGDGADKLPQRPPANRYLEKLRSKETKTEEIPAFVAGLANDELAHLSNYVFTSDFSSEANSEFQRRVRSAWTEALKQDLSSFDLPFEKWSDSEIKKRIELLEGLKDDKTKDENYRLIRKLRGELESREDERKDRRKVSIITKTVGATDSVSSHRGMIPVQKIDIPQDKVLWIICGQAVDNNGAMTGYDNLSRALRDSVTIRVNSLGEIESRRGEIQDLIQQGYRHVVITGHGSPYGMTVGGGNNNLVPQNAVAFGSIFRGATDIRMFSCELGQATGVIQGLATGSDASVTGSTALVYVGHDGQRGFVAVPAGSQWVAAVPHARRGEAANDPAKAPYMVSYRGENPEAVFPGSGQGVEYVNPGNLLRDNGPRVGANGQSERMSKNMKDLMNKLFKNGMAQNGGGAGGAGAGSSGGGAGGAGSPSGDSGRAPASFGSGFQLPQGPRDSEIDPALLDAIKVVAQPYQSKTYDFTTGIDAVKTVNSLLQSMRAQPAKPLEIQPGPSGN